MKLLQTEWQLVRHTRRLVFQLAEVAVSPPACGGFRSVLERLAGLCPVPG